MLLHIMAYSAWYGDHVSLKYLSSHKPMVKGNDYHVVGVFFFFFLGGGNFLCIICTRKCMSMRTQHIVPWAVLVIIWNVWFSNKFELLMGKEFHMKLPWGECQELHSWQIILVQFMSGNTSVPEECEPISTMPYGAASINGVLRGKMSPQACVIVR